MNNVIIVIPARLAATRLPNKPLADIAGLPMIVHVMKRAEEANLGPVLVACGDEEIASVIHYYGGTAILTDPNLPRGTDRIHAALESFDPKGTFTHVINLQGDLPSISPAYLKLLAEMLDDVNYDMVTLASPITTEEEKTSRNVVKAIVSLAPGQTRGPGLYFTRSPVGSGHDGTLYHHIGVYGFRRQALDRYVSCPPTPLECYESLEQLRILENGMRIGVGIVPVPPFGVDSAEDLERIRAELSKA